MPEQEKRKAEVEDTRAKLLDAVTRVVPNATVNDLKHMTVAYGPKQTKNSQAYQWVKNGYDFPARRRSIWDWTVAERERCREALRDGSLTAQPITSTTTTANMTQPQKAFGGAVPNTVTSESHKQMSAPVENFASLLAMKCASNKNLNGILKAMSSGTASAAQINTFQVISKEIKNNLAKLNSLPTTTVKASAKELPLEPGSVGQQAPLVSQPKSKGQGELSVLARTCGGNSLPESRKRKKSTSAEPSSDAQRLQHIAISTLDANAAATAANNLVRQQTIEDPFYVASEISHDTAAQDRSTTVEGNTKALTLNEHETRILSGAFQCMTSKSTIDFIQMTALLGHTDLFTTNTAYATLMTKLGIAPSSNAFATSSIISPTIAPFPILAPHIINSTTLKLFLTNNLTSPRRYIPLPLRTCPDLSSLIDNIIKAFDLETKVMAITGLVFTFEHLKEEVMVKEKLPESWEEMLGMVARAPCWEADGGRLWIGVGVEVEEEAVDEADEEASEDLGRMGW